MKSLEDMPLRRKVTFVILATCSTALLLACGILAAFQMIDFRRTIVRDMTVLGDVTAKNTRAALAFRDDRAAAETLLALQSEPSVVAACLYDEEGRPFATYVRAGESAQFPDRVGDDGVRFEGERLVLFRPVHLNTRRLGTLFIHCDSRDLHQRLQRIAGIAVLVLLGSCAVALLVSARLQRPISQPIFALAETVQSIAERKDYSLRVPPGGGYEIGKLTQSFNHLLGSIEERDNALRSANEELREEISERQAAELRVQAQLARLEMLHRITRAIGERQDLRSIFQIVIRTLEDHLPIDFCCVALYSSAVNTLTVTSVGVRSEALATDLALTEQSVIPIDQNGLNRCVHGDLVYEPNIEKSEFPFPKRLCRGGLRAFVAAPLLVESQVFGVLIAARNQAESFSSGECEFLRHLSEHVALAAHQAQIYTALQQAYDDLRQTQQAVMQQERLRALGQMASGIAHDINNAISPVALYTESLLETEPNLSDRARDYLATIQHAIDDVSQTVARMREFYRQREPQLALAPVRINPLIKQVLDLSRARWSDMPQQRGVVIQVATDLAPDPPAILGVESEIREALVNLVFNAVDAMPEGGTLTLRTRILSSDSSPPASVSVEVSDTGIGMDEETRRRCLEPFFTTKGERGTGLGLAMVYGIARRHSAEVEIQSAPGKGTTVSLSLPVAQEDPAASPTENKALIIRKSLRILVIDDDPLLIKSLRDTLEIDGHRVTTATDGRMGVAAFQEAQSKNQVFDAVITDLGMPGMDGRQVAAGIKQASAECPVILLTGWGRRLMAEGDIPACVDCVLSKPPKLRDLREALAQCVPHSAIS